MTTDTSQMSPEAQELIRLTNEMRKGRGDFSTVDVSALLNDHPELLKGLNEYLAWRDHENVAVAVTKKSAPLGHELRNLATKIRKKGGK